MNDYDEMPYNVAMRDKFTEEAIDWLEENMPGRFDYGGWTDSMVVSFRDEIDAVTFKMKWG